MSDSKVAEKTPCLDTGSIIKFYLNPFYRSRLGKHASQENAPVIIVGAGRCSDGDKVEFTERARNKIVCLSYRNCFPKLPNGSTTDSYWGCLVRTAQMVLAQVFMRHYGGGCSTFADDQVESLRDRVKPLFRDSATSPFSIHVIEEAAHDQGVKYARWLSPTQACKAAYVACVKYHQSGKPCPFPICCEDRNVNKAEVYAVLRRGEPTLLLVPVVMGVRKLNDKYQKVLLRCLEMEHCCGIAGGHGKASIYLFGHQGTTVFYLDPHFVQPAYLSKDTEGKTRRPHGALDVKKIDPCMFIGYYVPNETEFEKFLAELKEMNAFVAFPLISVSEDDPRKKVAADLNVSVANVDAVQADRVIAVGDDGAFSPVAGSSSDPQYPTEDAPPEGAAEEEAELNAPETNPLARGLSDGGNAWTYPT